MSNIAFSFFLITILFLLPACSFFQNTSGKSYDKITDAFTKELILNIKNTNDKIKSFKGTGSVKINKKNSKLSFRLVWIGLIPSKLRLAVLSSGRLIETISTDGKYIYLRSNTKSHQFYKHRTDDPDLDKVLEIPVKVVSLIDFMRGKIPISDFDDVQLLADTSLQKSILLLKKNWYGIVQKIYMDENYNPYKTEFFSSNGKLIYKVKFKKMQNVNGYLLPTLIDITDGDDTFVSITVDNIYLNPKLTPSKFTLIEQ